MKKVYKVGIIGLGRIAVEFPDNHLKAYEGCERVRLVALCDSNPDKKIDKYPFYTDYMEMIRKEKPDIVSVCTPPETHCDIVCNVAPYVKAIYCEKPIALTIPDGYKMVEICNSKRVILQINHQRLFVIPTFKYSRGILNTGTHMFSLINHLFKKGTSIYILRVDTDEPVFELDCTHNKEAMIPFGVTHLVGCLDNNKKSISSGEKGLVALRMCLQYKEQTGCD